MPETARRTGRAQPQSARLAKQLRLTRDLTHNRVQLGLQKNTASTYYETMIFDNSLHLPRAPGREQKNK